MRGIRAVFATEPELVRKYFRKVRWRPWGGVVGGEGDSEPFFVRSRVLMYLCDSKLKPPPNRPRCVC